MSNDGNLESRNDENDAAFAAGTGEEAASTLGNSEANPSQDVNTRKSVKNRSGKRAPLVKKDAAGIFRGTDQALSKQPDEITFLRNNAQIRDLQSFKEGIINQTAGFGGLKSQVTLALNVLAQRVFEGATIESTSRYLFFLGIQRGKVAEMLERNAIYEELFAKFVLERMKDWREP